MKKLVGIALTFFFVPYVTHASVQITEVAWMGTSASQYSEWLELYNDGNEAINLAGWKLYEGLGTTIFTFSKTIPSKGYLLLERTTASAPDAVPGVDDEAGPFGGGGLANTGEDLVLKDAGGTIIDELAYSDGWPAGDATTKDTMQLDGSTWRTAPATPKAPLGESGPQDSGDSTSPKEADIDPYPIPKVSPNKPQIVFTIPKTVYRGVSYEYNAEPVLEYNYRLTEGDLYWNMGDGTTIHQTAVVPIVHTYKYPGTYTISYSYKDHSYRNTTLTGSKTVEVKIPTITASIIDSTAIELKNASSTPVDLTDWTFLVNGQSIAIPPMTTLAAKATAVIPLQVFGITTARSVVLVDPSGVSTKQESFSSTRSTVYTQQPTALINDTVPAKEEIVISKEEENKSSSPIRNRTKTIIVGAVALFVIGLSILLERFMARQEY